MADLVIVLGGDRGVRNYFHHTLDIDTPVLGVSESESSGFLSQIELRDLRLYLSRLKKQDYVIESVPRIAVKIDGKNTHPVLNDVAVFTSKSATLMEHVLRVNDEEVWHDNSDGVIISTPIGSSAYSMSAGGPVIFQAANVFGIISVNSLDTTRRPLIVDTTCKNNTYERRFYSCICTCKKSKTCRRITCHATKLKTSVKNIRI